MDILKYDGVRGRVDDARCDLWLVMRLGLDLSYFLVTFSGRGRGLQNKLRFTRIDLAILSINLEAKDNARARYFCVYYQCNGVTTEVLEVPGVVRTGLSTRCSGQRHHAFSNLRQ